MKFEIIECQQRSGDWFAARLGRLTGSRAADMLALLKSGKGEAMARRRYRMDLLAERLTGRSCDEDQFVTAAMQRGIDLEATAFAEYEAVTGNLVNRAGFLRAVDLMAGCSIDGFIGDMEGIVELKCPKSVTHLEYLLAGEVPTDYLPQITHNVWVSGARWCDFVCFDDRFPPEMQIFLRRIEASTLDLPAYERAALAFLSEVDVDERALRLQEAA